MVAMTGAGNDEPEPPGGYIRGGAGVPTDTRRVLRIVLWALLGSLAILSIAMVVNGLHHNARAQRLQHHGVAVPVTVTSCLGHATGTGITVNGFTCRGSFALGGRHHNEVIGGSAALFSRGQVVQGVVDPQDPSNLSTARTVKHMTAASRPFALAAIPALALVVIGGLAYWGSRREGRH
jgi:hypothetical protein